jgi:hypothetical protein
VVVETNSYTSAIVYKTMDFVLPPSDCSHLSLVSFPLWQKHHMARYICKSVLKLVNKFRRLLSLKFKPCRQFASIDFIAVMSIQTQSAAAAAANATATERALSTTIADSVDIFSNRYCKNLKHGHVYDGKG